MLLLLLQELTVLSMMSNFQWLNYVNRNLNPRNPVNWVNPYGRPRPYNKYKIVSRSEINDVLDTVFENGSLFVYASQFPDLVKLCMSGDWKYKARLITVAFGYYNGISPYLLTKAIVAFGHRTWEFVYSKVTELYNYFGSDVYGTGCRSIYHTFDVYQRKLYYLNGTPYSTHQSSRGGATLRRSFC